MTGTLVVDSLAYSGNPIGDLHANISYRNKNLTGMVSVVNAPLAKNVTDSALIIDIASFPIDLALSGAGDRIIKGGNVEITAHANDLSIAPAEPFLPGTRIRGGTADADFTVAGSFPDLVYSGGGRISNARILVEGNNILYLLPTAELQFKDDILSIKDAILRNDPRDYPRGAARVNGAITFSGFSITNLDISAETPGLLVLSDATQAVNDLVYGDLVIASDGSPIHFHGSLDAPRLDGDITVQQGDLVFPESKGRESNTNVVKYIDYDTWLDRASQPYGPEFPTDTLASRGDSIRTAPTDSAQSGSLLSQSRDIRKLIETVQGRQTGGTTSLTDKILFDLNISIPGRLFVKMKLSQFEEVDAELATEGSPLHFVRGSDGKNHVTGTVSVLQGSRYNFFKTFDASGSLQFIEDLDNINLDLLATYSGRTFGTSGEIVHDYTVIVRISGTKRTPKVELDYTIDGKPPAVANQDERNRNAIALLLFGRTANELNSTTAGNSTLTGAAKSGFFAFTGSLSSNALNELVGGSRFVRSIGVDFGGSGGEGDNGQARLSVITQFGQVIVRYSGQINSPSNSLITVDLPLSVLVNSDWARHFVTQLELENQESGTSGTTLVDQSQEGLVRLQYRISW
jgi:hypothetical protein